MQFVTKLSSKTMNIEPAMEQIKDSAGRPKLVAKDCPENKQLYRVIGIASGVKSGVSAFGEWAAFLGDFTATVSATGEIFKSGKLFLPPIVSNMIQGAIMSGNAKVEFAFDIGVTPSERSAQGYEWTATPLLDVSASDPLEALIGKIKADPLPSPKKDEKGGEEKKDEQAPAESASGTGKKTGNGKK